MPGILNVKSSIILILLSDYFKKNKITRLSKKLTKCPIFGPFCPNASKNEIPAKVRLSFLRCKINVTLLKISEES